MFETTRYDARQRLLSTSILAGGLAAFGFMIMLIAPAVVEDVDFEAIIDQMPPGFADTFGLTALGTVEGFLAVELYQFIWIIGLGAYLAYSAASSIADDLETGRMDTILAAPIARWRVLLEKYLALLLPILGVNLIVFFAVYAGGELVQEPLNPTDLGLVHLLSVPYLLACGAIGILAAVIAPRRLIAEGLAAGSIIGTFLINSVVATTTYSWIGVIAPMRYYDPLAILTASEYDYLGAAILLAAAATMLNIAAWWFGKEDLR